jgi:hypothetical protein
MLVMVNACHGGFSLSPEAMTAYAARKGITLWIEDHNFYSTYWTRAPEDRPGVLDGDEFYKADIETSQESNRLYSEYTISESEIHRDDPDMIAVVQELGSDKSSGRCAQIALVEIPDDVEWEIEEYDGREWVAETHRVWHP